MALFTNLAGDGASNVEDENLHLLVTLSTCPGSTYKHVICEQVLVLPVLTSWITTPDPAYS